MPENPAPSRAGNGETGQTSRLPTVFRALQYRNYRLFFSGQIVSLVGTWMQTVAESWLVYRLTGSSLLLGLVGFFGRIPIFLLAPIGGMLADRHSRHKLVIGTQTTAMVLAGILAGLTLAGRIRVWEIMALAAALGIVYAVDIPTRQSFIVEMIHPRDLINAIALNSSMVNCARVLGPGIAGLVVAAIGEGWCFFANATSYIAVVAGLLLMRITPRARYPRSSGLKSVVEGFHWVAKTGPIRALMLLLGIVSLTGMPYVVLMPIFADRILHHGARGLGILMSSTGVGALTGTLVLAAKRGVRGLGKWIMLAALGFGCGLILFSLSQVFWLSCLILVPTGFALMLHLASCNTLIQTMVPDELRGRVMAVYSMMFMGMAPFGSLLAGATAQHLGARLTVAIGGFICVSGAVTFAYAWRSVRAEARQLVMTQTAAIGEPPIELSSQDVAAAEGKAE
jgi:MFS family permease